MKKYILIILFILSTISIFSQNKILTRIEKDEFKLEFAYNSSDIFISYQTFLKNSDGINWDFIAESTVTYNSDNKVELEIVKDWDGTELVNNSKYEYLYDTDLNKVQSTKYYWNSSTNVWENPDETFYTYNSDNYLIQTEGNSKTEYIYDVDNKLITKKRYSWNSDSSDWNTQSGDKYEYEYNGDNNLINFTHYFFHSDASEWREGDYRFEYSYNNTYTEDDLILPNIEWIYDFWSFNHMLTTSEELTWNSITSTWESDLSVNFIYSDSTLNINDNQLNLIQVYPNPFEDILYFKNSDNGVYNIEIFDIKGVLVKQIKSNSFLNLKDLQKGLYIYKINKENSFKTGKILKK